MRSSGRLRAAGLLVAAGLVLAGCGRDLGPARFGGATPIRPAAFRAHDAASNRPPTPIAQYIPSPRRAERVQIRSLSEAEAMEGVGAIDTDAGSPRMWDPAGDAPPPSAATGTTPRRAIDPASLTLVDAKVGDLNGLPIVARSWLEPLGPRLRAESAGKTRNQWRQVAAQAINERLMDTLRDELYLAEARASLTAQQRAGLRVFLERFERDVVRSSYGSQTLADERLRQATGGGLDAARRERERFALISQVQQQKILDRVQVTSRDLALEYERNAAEFNPPPRAVFRLVRVRSAEAETVAEIDAALRARPFDEVADDERNLSPEPAVREIKDGLAETELFGQEDLQQAAAALAPGRWAGPIDTGVFTYWILLDRIEDESRSLYDVQLELRQRIFDERAREEAGRYLFRLAERAGVDNLGDLVGRLVEVAEAWYFQENAPP
jgi:hypothetical protein